MLRELSPSFLSFSYCLTTLSRRQLAEQYGSEVASDVISRSRSNLHLDSMPTMPYTPRNKTPYNDTKYDALDKTLLDDSI